MGLPNIDSTAHSSTDLKPDKIRLRYPRHHINDHVHGKLDDIVVDIHGGQKVQTGLTSGRKDALSDSVMRHIYNIEGKTGTSWNSVALEIKINSHQCRQGH